MQALGVFAQPQRLPSQLTSVRHVICSVGQMNSPQQKAWCETCTSWFNSSILGQPYNGLQLTLYLKNTQALS